MPSRVKLILPGNATEPERISNTGPFLNKIAGCASAVPGAPKALFVKYEYSVVKYEAPNELKFALLPDILTVDMLLTFNRDVLTTAIFADAFMVIELNAAFIPVKYDVLMLLTLILVAVIVCDTFRLAQARLSAIEALFA